MKATADQYTYGKTSNLASRLTDIRRGGQEGFEVICEGPRRNGPAPQTTARSRDVEDQGQSSDTDGWNDDKKSSRSDIGLVAVTPNGTKR